MRKNKKNWEIFSKSWKENAIVCDHIPTTPALITTTFNNGDSMMVETMNEGKDKYKVESITKEDFTPKTFAADTYAKNILEKKHFNKKYLETVKGIVYLICDTSTVASLNQYENRKCKLEANNFEAINIEGYKPYYRNQKQIKNIFFVSFKKKVAQ